MADIKYKQFVIVPKKPKMSPGKIASQVAHATFLALDNGQPDYDSFLLIKKWKENGMCVIVLDVEDENKLKNISAYLDTWNISHHLYIDEGIYGCKPFTATALATGIVTEDKFWIFENLRLYK